MICPNPECRKEIIDGSAFCRFCGTKIEIGEKTPDEKPSKTGKPNLPLKTILLVALGIVAVIVIVALLNSKPSSARVMNYIQKGDYERARIVYESLGEEEKDDVLYNYVSKYLEEIFKEYTKDEISYEDARELIQGCESIGPDLVNHYLQRLDEEKADK